MPASCKTALRRMPDLSIQELEAARLQEEHEAVLFLLREMTARAGGELVHDLQLDEANSALNFRRIGCQPGKRDVIKLDECELARLRGAAGSERTGIVLSPRATGGALELHLADARSAGHWRKAIIVDKVDARRLGQPQVVADSMRKACTIAHELRQPLFTISVVAERLCILSARMAQHGAEVRSALSQIATQVERADKIISRTLGLHESCEAKSPFDVAQAARNAVNFLEAMASSTEVLVEVHADRGSTPVNLDGLALEQVFVNILRNSLEAIHSRRAQGWRGAGRIAVNVTVANDLVHATIVDNGSGMTVSACRSGTGTVPSKRGAGLGLSICRDILEPAGGGLELRPTKERGTIVELKIPLANSPE